MIKRIPISTIISVVSAIAAIASAFFAYYQGTITHKQLYLHIRPQISIEMSFTKRYDYLQPVLSIRNRSPINIVALSVDYQFLLFDRVAKKFHYQWSSLTSEQVFQDHLIFRKKLEPNHFMVAELGDVIQANHNKYSKSIFIFVLFSTHYRESDMERFDNKKIFFVEEGKIFQHSDFMALPDYEKIFPVINSVQPPNYGSFRNVSGELMLKNSKSVRNRTEAERAKTSKEDPGSHSRKPPPEPTGIRIFHTDE